MLLFLSSLVLAFLVTVYGIKCPNVAFVVHSNSQNDNVTDFMSKTFLRDTNLIIMSGHDSHTATVSSRRKLRMRKVLYDGNPGGMGKTFRTEGSKYLGTHRTMAGILVAMDTMSDVDWVYVLDDDNTINVDTVCATLNKIDPSVPLLLGYVGPKRGHPPCREFSSESQWTCCKDVRKPCLVTNKTSPFSSSKFLYDENLKTMTPWNCADPKHHCCQVVPWPEGIMYGYPYRMRKETDENDEVVTTIDGINLWPYGGATYAISKAMLHAVGRDKWEKYMYQLQCSNADINVMTTIFNAGYSIHQFDHVLSGSFAPHHVHTIAEQFGTFAITHQPRDVLDAACKYDNISHIVKHETYQRFCSNVKNS